MKDYSNEIVNFEHIDLTKIINLIGSINEIRTPDIDRIRRRFEETSSNFEDVFTFLYQISLIELRNSHIFLSQRVNISNKKELRMILIRFIFKNA